MSGKTRIRKRRKHKYFSPYKFWNKELLKNKKWIKIETKEFYCETGGKNG